MSRGGARPGAGRPKGTNKKIIITLPAELIARKPDGMSMSEWITAGMVFYTDQHK
jgi:hypothetical protein